MPTGPMARIAFEKAGIAKQGVPLVTLSYLPESNREVLAAATRAGASLAMQGDAWDCHRGAMLTYRDAEGTFTLPRPALSGAHQAENAGLALAMLRHQDRIAIGPVAMARGLKAARWPARMQRLKAGPITGAREVWLDGGHNPQAGAMIGQHFAGQRLHLVIGMIEGKDPASLIGPLADSLASITAVPVPGHEWHPATAFGPAARPAPDVPSAMAMIPDDGLPILIAGSLYLAGEVLRLNNELPD